MSYNVLSCYNDNKLPLLLGTCIFYVLYRNENTLCFATSSFLFHCVVLSFYLLSSLLWLGLQLHERQHLVRLLGGFWSCWILSRPFLLFPLRYCWPKTRDNWVWSSTRESHSWVSNLKSEFTELKCSFSPINKPIHSQDPGESCLESSYLHHSDHLGFPKKSMPLQNHSER